jgi:hypothetical protein
LRTSWLVAAAITLAAPAYADGTQMFPLSGGGLPRTLRDAPGELTRVLAKSLGDGAIIGNVPIEDAADLLECKLTARTCLDKIASSVDAKKIIFGRVDHRGGTVVVKLTTFEAGGSESTRTFSLDGATTDELVTALADQLGNAANKDNTGEGKPPPIVDEPPTEPLVPDKPETTPAEPRRGEITTGTWSLIVGGAVGVAVGGGFLVSANGLERELAKAPTETRADIDRLLALERAGKTRTQIGGVLMVAGGAAMTAGIIRAVLQKRSPAEERTGLEINPEQGGASVSFTWRWK